MNRKIVVLLAACLAASGCSRNSDDLPATSTNTLGDWKVQFYRDKKDEITDFEGLIFRFHHGGHTKAVKGSLVVNGNWSKTSNDLTLQLGTDPILSALNCQWQIVEFSGSNIKP